MRYLNRCGMIARKLGMTQLFNDVTGSVVPVTVLSAEQNIVVNVTYASCFIYKIAAVLTKKKQLNSSHIGQFKHLSNTPYMKIIKEFKLGNKDNLKIGDIVQVTRYNIGQYIDVSSHSIGKGFAGGMKRHNFKGLEASHGVSLSHRSLGSTGQCQDPGKVFKGKKMPGQMGNVRTTVQNIKIIDVDKKLNLIIVKGSVPGSKNSLVFIKDAVKKTC